MAVGWSVILEGEAPLPDAASGKSLLYYQRQVDDLAVRLGLTRLSSFFSRDPRAIARYMQDQGVEPDMDALPDEEWFEPEDALTTVRGLLDAIRADAAVVPEAPKIAFDLEGIERELDAAMIAGVRFHLGRELPRHEPE